MSEAPQYWLSWPFRSNASATAKGQLPGGAGFPPTILFSRPRPFVSRFTPLRVSLALHVTAGAATDAVAVGSAVADAGGGAVDVGAGVVGAEVAGGETGFFSPLQASIRPEHAHAAKRVNVPRTMT